MRQSHLRGFTLVEILIAVAIIAVLLAMILPRLGAMFGMSRELTTEFRRDAIVKAAAEFREKGSAREGRYPAEDADSWVLTATLVRELADKGVHRFSENELAKHPAFADRLVVVDGWQNPFKYKVWLGKQPSPHARNEKTFDLWSAGEDGVYASADDICNWTPKMRGLPYPW